jgi:dTDP-D-glucose 4,6-dehydratase
VLKLLGKPESLITYVKDRPGHDRRYAMDCSKIRQNGAGKAKWNSARASPQTIEWYKSHQDWMHEIKDASYLSYYDRMYTHRDDTLSRLHS